MIRNKKKVSECVARGNKKILTFVICFEIKLKQKKKKKKKLENRRFQNLIVTKVRISFASWKICVRENGRINKNMNEMCTTGADVLEGNSQIKNSELLLLLRPSPPLQTQCYSKKIVIRKERNIPFFSGGQVKPPPSPTSTGSAIHCATMLGMLWP